MGWLLYEGMSLEGVGMENSEESLRRYLEEYDEEEALRLWLFSEEIKQKSQLLDYNSIAAIRSGRHNVGRVLDVGWHEESDEPSDSQDDLTLQNQNRLNLAYQNYLEQLFDTIDVGSSTPLQKMEAASIENLFAGYEKIMGIEAAKDVPGWSAMDWLLSFIEQEIMPPPEILRSIASSYKQYIKAEGTSTLEQAFFDPEKLGKQNYSKTLNAHNRYKRFFYDVQMLMVSDENHEPKWSSLTEFARNHLSKYRISDGKVLTDDEFEDYVEAFLRGYRRWKKKMRPDNSAS